MRAKTRSLLRPYAGVTLLIAASFGIRAALDPLFGRYPAPFFFLFAVAFGAWLGGFRVGMFATLATTLINLYFFMPPLHSLSLTAADDKTFVMGLYVGLGTLFSLLSEALRAEKRRAERGRQKAEAAQEALLAADRRKNEFIAMLGHELRNPLAPIRNAVQLMKRAGPDDPRQAWAREVIDRQTDHLAHLVDDLLDMSRIVKGKFALRKVPMDIATVINWAVEGSRPAIEARRHALTVSLPREPMDLEGDPVRLTQVVSNLLDNAAKYTPPGGRIWLSAAREGGEAVVSVRDSGEGIPAALLPHLFEAFTQEDRTLDRSQGGLGLGLTIVRKIVELHGGRIEARSEGAGTGSEFVVRLPLDDRKDSCEMGQ